MRSIGRVVLIRENCLLERIIGDQSHLTLSIIGSQVLACALLLISFHYFILKLTQWVYGFFELLFVPLLQARCNTNDASAAGFSLRFSSMFVFYSAIVYLK